MPNLFSIYNVEWVSQEIIQQKFNDSQYHERVLNGELTKHIWGYDNHLNRRARRKAREPKCTRSQMVIYSTLDSKPVALVHQYKRRDGQLGGSGHPDPKRIILEDRVLAFRREISE